LTFNSRLLNIKIRIAVHNEEKVPYQSSEYPYF